MSASTLPARPRPIDYEVPAWPLHVSVKSEPRRALCGGDVLPHCYPPKAIELGRPRGDGSVIQIAEVELEAGYLATVPRHPEHGCVLGLCRGCLARVERLRWPRRARAMHVKARQVKLEQAAATKAQPGRRRITQRAARWLEGIAAVYGDE